MGTIQRKVAFYHLTQERTGEDRQKHAVSNTDIEANFQYIYDKMTVLENQRHAAKITNSNVKVVVEVVQYNSNEHIKFYLLLHYMKYI